MRKLPIGTIVEFRQDDNYPVRRGVIHGYDARNVRKGEIFNKLDPDVCISVEDDGNIMWEHIPLIDHNDNLLPKRTGRLHWCHEINITPIKEQNVLKLLAKVDESR